MPRSQVERRSEARSLTQLRDTDVRTLVAPAPSSPTGTLAAPGTATMECRANGTSGNWVDRSITAIKVPALAAPLEALDLDAPGSED